MAGGGDDRSKGPDFGEAGRLPSDLFENSGADEQLLADASPFRDRPMPAGPGRPRGAANKRTVKMRELYLKMGLPHPLLWQGAMLRMGIDGVMQALGCTLLEAAELLRKIANDAAPYLESRMPLAVEATGDTRPVLIMGEISADQLRQRPEGAMAIDDELVLAVERFQALKVMPTV